MLSRVAENLYWLGRYAERAENLARIVNVNAHMLLDLPRGIAPGWAPLIAITGSQAQFETRYSNYDERSVVKFLLVDADTPYSVVSTLHAARENMRTVRDTVPREAWEVVNELYHDASDNAARGIAKRTRHEYIQRIIRGTQSLAGLLLGTMNHDEGYTFLTLGRTLERADMTTRIIDVRSESLLPSEASELRPFEDLQWMSVLKSLSGHQMYRRTMHARIRRAAVLQFLLCDPHFPRAIARCASRLESMLTELPRNDAPLRALASLKRTVSRADVGYLAREPAPLHEFADDLQRQLADLHTLVDESYFLQPQEAVQVQEGAAKRS